MLSWTPKIRQVDSCENLKLVHCFFQNNRHIGPQGYTIGNFNAQIRINVDEKPYPGYNMSILWIFKNLEKITHSPT